MLKPGERFGRLRIDRLLGEGGMGAVYAATDETTGRQVALKVLLPAAGKLHAQTLERFRREARAAAAVSHPNVVTLHGVEHGENEALGLVFEIVTGGSLKDRVDRAGRLPWREAVAFTLEAARGVAAIHAKGLVHRDVKPQNLLLDSQGKVKVSDLGLVRTIDAEGPQITVSGQILGTAEYLAPEGQEEAPVGPAADLYALGATLHHLVAGQPPFVGAGYALLKQHAFDAPTRLRAEVSDVPPALEALALRLLAKDPRDRGTIERLVAELEKLGEPPPRGRTTPLAVGAAALVVLVAIAAAVVLGRATPPLRDPVPVPTTTPPKTAAPSPPRLRLGRDKRLEHVTPPEFLKMKRTFYVREASLSHNGKYIVLGGASGRFVSWILEAVTLEPTTACLAYAATTADPLAPVIYAGTPEGEVVAIENPYPTGGTVRWRRKGPTMLAATIAVDAVGERVYTGWQGGPPDPVLIHDRGTGEVRKNATAGNGPTVMRILADTKGHVFVNSHRQPYKVENFLVTHWTPGAASSEVYEQKWAVGVSPAEQVLLFDTARGRLGLLDPVLLKETLTEVPLGSAPIAAVSATLAVVAVPGGVQLLSVPAGRPVGEPLILQRQVNGMPAQVATLLADDARSRVIALVDDPNGEATRVVSIEVENLVR